MEVELMVTNVTTSNGVNIEQSASGRLEGRVLQLALGLSSNKDRGHMDLPVFIDLVKEGGAKVTQEI